MRFISLKSTMLGEICLVPRVSNLFVDSKSLHTEGMNLQIFTVLNVMRARRAGAGKAVQSTEEVDAVVIGNLSMLTRGEGNTTGGGGNWDRRFCNGPRKSGRADLTEHWTCSGCFREISTQRWPKNVVAEVLFYLCRSPFRELDCNVSAQYIQKGSALFFLGGWSFS